MDMRKFIVALFFFIMTFAVFTAFAGTINGKVTASKLKSPKDILVYIDKIEGKEFAPPKEPAKMDQISLVFVPRVLPLVKGTTVDFHNSDDVKHNVFGVGADDFDLGTWGKGGVRSYTFNKLGEVAILCNVHPEMEAYAIVLENPYFTLTDEEGKYQLQDVPAGTYKLKTWRDTLRPATKEIELSGTGEVTIDFDLK